MSLESHPAPPADAPPGQRTPEPAWAAIRVAGRDAKTFLQGQLTHDLRSLTADAGLRAALCSPQGRVAACVWLVETAPAAGEAGVWIALPGELAVPAAAALRRYVLRARLRISADPEHASARAWLVDDAAILDAAFSNGAASAPALAVRHTAGGTWLRTGPRRALGIPDAAAASSDAATFPATAAPLADRVAFELAAIRDGEPMVYGATREHWVPQMLNLDLVDGISFAKGCYTGQEIVTRTQHRGQIKRRMLRYALRGAAPPSPGDTVLSASGKAGEIVRAAVDGADAELLAVISLDQASAPLRLESGAVLEPRPLPYPLG